jgi:hypothetical protein
MGSVERRRPLEDEWLCQLVSRLGLEAFDLTFIPKDAYLKAKDIVDEVLTARDGRVRNMSGSGCEVRNIG